MKPADADEVSAMWRLYSPECETATVSVGARLIRLGDLRVAPAAEVAEEIRKAIATGIALGMGMAREEAREAVDPRD